MKRRDLIRHLEANGCELLLLAQEERSRLIPELQSAQLEAERLKNKHQRWSNGWLFKRVFKNYFTKLGEMATEAVDSNLNLKNKSASPNLQLNSISQTILRIPLATCAML